MILLFTFYLTPISFSIGYDKVSANYLFILFPVIVLIFNRKIQIPPKNILAIMFIYILIFISCLVYQIDYYKFWERRFISFILFMSMFTFFFVKIDESMSKAFKYAVILISILYSLNSISFYFIYKYQGLGFFEIKYHVQSQRYGFILLFGFWLLIFERANTSFKLAIKLISILIVFNGLGLTYSRSSVAGLIVSSCSLILLYILNFKSYQLKTIPYANISSFLIYLVFSISIVTVSYYLIPDYFQYFSGRLLKISITPLHEIVYFPYSSYPFYNTTISLFTSESYRIFMIVEMFKFLSYNPLFGSGYLGVWIMFESLSAASHNQLLDVFFRTGIIGFIPFLYILYRIFKYNFDSGNKAVLISLMGIIVIGFFHETFKLSQGAFLFSFLASQAFNCSLIEKRL